MDLEKKKYKIIEALLAVEEPKVLRDLEEILRIDAEVRHQNDVLIEEAEDDIKAGRTFSLDEAKKMIFESNKK